MLICRILKVVGVRSTTEKLCTSAADLKGDGFLLRIVAGEIADRDIRASECRAIAGLDVRFYEHRLRVHGDAECGEEGEGGFHGNVQRPTSNIQSKKRPRLRSCLWMLDVGYCMLIRLVDKPSALNGGAQFGVPRLRGLEPPEGGTPNSFAN